MTKFQFQQHIKEVKKLVRPYEKLGYSFTTKDIEETDGMFSFEAKLKKGNIDIRITVLDGGMSNLTRYNSYTQAKQECYFGEELFSAKDLKDAIEFNFPMLDSF